MFDDLTACRNYQPNEELFSQIGIPVNIILGGKDRLIDPDQAEVFARNLSSKIYKIDNAGHFPFFEDPVDLSNIIKSVA